MLMDKFYQDIAGLVLILGIAGVFYGLSMYKWNSSGWKIPAALMALFGVFGIGYGIAIYLNIGMGIVSIALFGGVVSYALFMVGHENSNK